MTIITFLYFLAGLGLLIFIHELGHFLVAKWAGIRVEQFSLGFGPKLIGFRWGETEYKISILPLGGYVKMSGEEPEEGDIKPLDDPRSFAAQPLWKRVLVVLAGPTMNLALALVLMPMVFLLGHQEPSFLHQEPVVIGVKKDSPAEKNGLQKGDKITEVDSKKAEHWQEVLQAVLMSPNQDLNLKIARDGQEQNLKIKLESDKEGKVGYLGIEPHYFIGNDPIIDQVGPDSPAQRAGMQAKDKIIAIEGQPIADWQEMSDAVGASQGKALQVQIQRGSELQTLSVTPRYEESLKKYILGVTKFVPEGSLIHVHYGFTESIRKGWEEYQKLIGLTFKVLKKLFSFELSYKALGGPVQIAQATAKAAETGFGDFLYFLAFLSIQLGVMNLLPIPVLDGGHLLFMLFEAGLGKPLSMRTRMISMQVGMALLFSLMILVTINDLSNIQSIRRLVEFIGSKF